MNRLLQDLRYALRQLRKSPGFTAVAVVTLALGIGANTAVFSAIDAILLKPLPFPHGDELMLARQYLSTVKSTSPFVAPVRLEDWNRMNSTFQALTGYDKEDVSETSAELPEKITRAGVAPRFLQVWGIAPMLGRDFAPEEEHFGGPTVVLISERLWRNHFHGDPNVIGKKLWFGKNANAVVGVMPESFLFPDKDVDVWMPVPPDAPYANDRNSTWYTVVGRLKPGISVEQAQANLSTVQTQLGKQFPQTDAKLAVEITPLKENTVGGARRSLWVLYGSVTLLLLIACTNIAALLLARMTDREHGIFVRFSLGASRRRLIAQLLTEMLVLAFIGAAAGLGLAGAGTKAFRMLAPDLPRVQEITIDWRILSYALISSVVVTLLCGILPAMRSTRKEIGRGLASGGRTQVGLRGPLQWILVAVQVALAVTLLTGAGLLLRSLQELARVSPGFDPNHVLTLHISAGWGETADMKGLTQKINRILDGLRAVPGVEGAATSLFLPGVVGQQPSDAELKILEGEQDPNRKVVANPRFVSTGYFAVTRIPLLAGESCHDEPNTVVVNRSFANRYFPSNSPFGHHLNYNISANFPLQGEIRGIVADAREDGINSEPVPTVYWCMSAPVPDPYYLLRTRGEPLAMSETIRRTIRQLEPNRSVFDIEPLTEHLSESFAEDRLRTMLLSFFGLTAVSLASLGIYGTLSYFVNIRRREVGVRLALGALRQQIASRFLFEGLRAAAIGCACGLALAAISSRLLSGMLYAVSSLDAVTFGGVMVLVLGVAALSTFIPAAHAARTDPMQVLREE
jgi:putative ABC transport system permease protein